MPWICSCLAGDYWVLGHGVARGYLNYFKDAAIASPLAFAINQLYFYGLVLLIKSELCSSNLAVSGEAQRTLFSEACWWKFLYHTLGGSFILISKRPSMLHFLAAVGKKG